MAEQHNSQIVGKKLEPEMGECRLLCCNKANLRSPIFGDSSKLSEVEQLETLADILIDYFFETEDDKQ